MLRNSGLSCPLHSGTLVHVLAILLPVYFPVSASWKAAEAHQPKCLSLPPMWETWMEFLAIHKQVSLPVSPSLLVALPLDELSRSLKQIIKKILVCTRNPGGVGRGRGGNDRPCCGPGLVTSANPPGRLWTHLALLWAFLPSTVLWDRCYINTPPLTCWGRESFRVQNFSDYGVFAQTSSHVFPNGKLRNLKLSSAARVLFFMY